MGELLKKEMVKKVFKKIIQYYIKLRIYTNKLDFSQACKMDLTLENLFMSILVKMAD